MYKFFADEENVSGKSITITGKDVNHIKNVLRMKTGEKILIGVGGNADYRCSISEISDDMIRADIEDVSAAVSELAVKIYLFQGIPKSDKMDMIVQKAVELGAYEIIPVATKRSVVRLDKKKAAAKVKRWNLIAESAAKQSKRSVIPKVHDVMAFDEAVDYASRLGMFVMPYEGAENISRTREVFEGAREYESIGIFIGPEGGFADNETHTAAKAGAEIITLGRRILRTETAGLAALSILMYILEE